MPRPATAGFKRLSGEYEGLLRLRVGNYRVLFDQTADTITIHRVRHRRDAYQRAAHRIVYN
jgi:mRNA-degrading endonuclease RelE of RelBE toxin-antitoxin system